MRTVLLPSGLLLALLTGIARPAKAQAVAPAPPLVGRNYVGLGGAVGGFTQGSTGSASVLAPTISAGRRLTVRLALELGGLVYHTRDDYTSQGVYVDTSATGGLKGATFRSVYQRRTQAVSLALRYALVQRPASRLALDVVAGLALVHTDAYGYNATLDQATQQLVQGSFYARYDQTSGCLLLGPSLRYQARPHLELVGEFIGNFAPGERVARLGGVAGTLGLSARYCFGATSLSTPRLGP